MYLRICVSILLISPLFETLIFKCQENFLFYLFFIFCVNSKNLKKQNEKFSFEISCWKYKVKSIKRSKVFESIGNRNK